MKNTKTIWRAKGFGGYLGAQFLGALNDNVFKTVLSLMAIEAMSRQLISGSFLWWIQMVFVIPWIMFITVSGYLADRYPKNMVLVGCKWLEVGALVLAYGFFIQTNYFGLLCFFTLITIRAVLFSPAKYAILADFFPSEELSRANGLVEMSTFVAIVLGEGLAAFLYQHFDQQTWIINSVMLLIATLGLFSARQIPQVSAPDEKLKFKWDFWPELVSSFRYCLNTKGLTSAVVGLASFYALGLIFQPALLLFARQVLHFSYGYQGLLLSGLGLMMGLGCLIAGFLSGSKIEFGLIPFGALGMTVGLFTMGCASDVQHALIGLTLLGLFSGCFIVPLHALIQHLPAEHQKGRIIAFSHMVQGVFMLVAVIFFWVASEQLFWSSRQILYALGMMSCVLVAWTLFEEPRFLLRFLVHLLVRVFYRLRVVGESHLPLKGGALIVCNHVTFIDGLVLASVFPRFLRFLIHRKYYMYFQPFLKYCYGIPIESGNPKLVAQSIARAREQLVAGHVICIFAEGALTRTGNLLRFRSGFEKIVAGLDVPIIPVHLDQLWGSFFSHRDGKLFRKWPDFKRSELIVSIGEPMPSHSRAWQVRWAIQNLGADARMEAKRTQHTLSHQFVSMAKKKFFKKALFEKHVLTSYGHLMIQAWEWSKMFKRQLSRQERVGVFLERSGLCALTILSLTLGGYSLVLLPKLRQVDWEAWMKQFGLKHLMTTTALFQAYGLPESLRSRCIFVDLAGGFKKYSYWRRFYYAVWPIRPAGDPDREHVILCRDPLTNEETDTQTLKWVVLSHANISSAIQSMHHVLTVKNRDRLLSVLPTDFVFGYVWGLWFPLLTGMSVIFPRYTSDDWSEIGYLANRHRATFLIDTTTAYRRYTKEFSKELFLYLRLAIVGGSRLPRPLLNAFEQKFKIPLFEGFGLAETSGIISVNFPDVPLDREFQIGHKDGSLGQLLPGIGVRIVDPKTGEMKKVGEAGLLWVKGLNLMQGYYKEQSSIVLKHDGRWLNTGIDAVLDEDGFLFFPNT